MAINSSGASGSARVMAISQAAGGAISQGARQQFAALRPFFSPQYSSGSYTVISRLAPHSYSLRNVEH